MPQAPAKRFSGIFVCYRRDDSAGHAGRLYDRLSAHFGDSQVFMDLTYIEPGEDFVQVIENAVGSCEILIAIIGRHWLSTSDGSSRRLDSPNDFVRLEIVAALNRDIRVIPVLVHGATMPKPDALPEDLARFTRRNAIELSDLRWQSDVDRLIGVMERVLAKRQEKTSLAVPSQAGIEFILIPPGAFMMGSDNGGDSEKPVHQVTINYSFFMGKYQVTQAQWQSVMGSNPSDFKDCANCPVEQVSWDDAQSFINELNESDDGFLYRLPTEAEWEYACRAGITTHFAFGDSLSSDQANFDGNYPYGGAAKGVDQQKTTAVGSFAPNALGVYDMHGNVYEWCEDWYHATYAGAPTDGSAWLSGGEQKYRVLRGGSWVSHASALRSACRFNVTPDFCNSYFGFRVVAVVRTS